MVFFYIFIKETIVKTHSRKNIRYPNRTNIGNHYDIYRTLIGALLHPFYANKSGAMQVGIGSRGFRFYRNEKKIGPWYYTVW